MCSYLSNRQQYVQIDDGTSGKLIVSNGVPQGNILGPILFNIYVHDINKNTRGNAYQSFKPEFLDENVQRINEDFNNIIK